LYIADTKLAQSTVDNYRYNAKRYLSDWKNRSLYEIGNDRAGMRLLQRQITRDYGPATANQVTRLISAVYRWHRKVDQNLPECPTTAIEVHHIEARDGAYSTEALKAWWYKVVETDGKNITSGVKTLGPLKRAWWLTALLTGARSGSVEALKWTEVDFKKKTIQFKVAKGNRPYSVPMSDLLFQLLERYHDSEDVSPSEWVFPSPSLSGRHIVHVKNKREGVAGPHRLRHTFRTTLAEFGASSDQARMLMGHAMGGDISRGYITAPLLIESLRPVTNAVSEHYRKILSL